MKRKYFLGIDIGGTKSAVLAGTEKMEFLEKIQFATESDKGPQCAIGNLIHSASDIINKLNDCTLQAIGISCGGPLDSKKGIILSPPNLPGWDNLPVTKILNDKFNVPVYLQNDANACALAEWKYGAGKGTRNMIFLTFGTGLGAGLILDGKLYTGTNDLAGEIGHIRLAEDGPLAYGKNGSFESFCSGSGIARMAQSVIKKKLSMGEKVPFIDRENGIKEISTKILAEAALKGDKTALEIFKESGKYLGIGLSILIDVLNPQRIVIGSVYARNPQLFNESCLQVVEKEALKNAAEVCEIVPAALGDKVGDFACLSIAILGHENAMKEDRSLM